MLEKELGNFGLIICKIMLLPIRALKLVIRQSDHIPNNSDFAQYVTKTLYMQGIFQVNFHGDIQILDTK